MLLNPVPLEPMLQLSLPTRRSLLSLTQLMIVPKPEIVQKKEELRIMPMKIADHRLVKVTMMLTVSAPGTRRIVGASKALDARVSLASWNALAVDIAIRIRSGIGTRPVTATVIGIAITAGSATARTTMIAIGLGLAVTAPAIPPRRNPSESPSGPKSGIGADQY